MRFIVSVKRTLVNTNIVYKKLFMRKNVLLLAYFIDSKYRSKTF